VHVIFSVIPRKELKNVFKIIKSINPKAFYTVEDIRSTRKNEYLVVKKGNFLNKRI
jgi:uncharacterized membrane-anchored protein YitT (DUF2179 family)